MSQTSPMVPQHDDARRVRPEGTRDAMGGIFRLAWRHYVSQCLYTFVKIGAPNAIGGDELSPAEIAGRLDVSVNVGYLSRVLRLLACEGVVTERPRGEGDKRIGVYALTDIGKLMQEGIPGQPAMNCVFEYDMSSSLWTAWGKFHEAMVAPHEEGGRLAIPFEMAHGKPLFDFYREVPDEARPFHKCMTALSALEMPAVLEYDWSVMEGKTLVDLGGGLGSVMEAVANKHPGIGRVVSLDLAEVVEGAPTPSNDKVELVAGNFFEPSTIPECDGILMKHILHDWADEPCRKIIKSCHQALTEGGRLIIADAVTSDYGDTSPASTPAMRLDIMMLMIVGSKERSAEEWIALLCGDGLFELVGITATEVPLSIIECIKV